MSEVFACSETPPAFLAPEVIAPLCIDLFCGLGGWTEGFLAEGYRVVGFDIEIRPYPAQLVIQDVLTIHGLQFKDATVIVASPPCQGYSYRAMPWKKAKALPPPDNALFEACFRIQREANCAIAHTCCERCRNGHHCVRPDCFRNEGRHARRIPLIVENVRGANAWVSPKSTYNYGSFHLWGDVPPLMPLGSGVKNGGDWFGSGADCSLQRRASFRSQARKDASALVAKIPFELARHVAAVYYPRILEQALRPQGAAGETMSRA